MFPVEGLGEPPQKRSVSNIAKEKYALFDSGGQRGRYAFVEQDARIAQEPRGGARNPIMCWTPQRTKLQ